ncbi:MAG: hypothetical protein EZS28_019196 [Streblomastix strix]|uniref:Uncharacterized protein n=1 Tax=Streblomastix strix TaxID=222440 RepID=A0A5J4VRK2_9EUKA|nr:MAG: hypothetical protein EZS28_019196 [Streblomastix strix]
MQSPPKEKSAPPLSLPYLEVPPGKRRRRKIRKMELQPVPRVSQREAKGKNNNKTERERARKNHNKCAR